VIKPVTERSLTQTLLSRTQTLSVESDIDSVLGRQCEEGMITYSDDKYQQLLAEEERGSNTDSLPTDTYSDDTQSENEH